MVGEVVVPQRPATFIYICNIEIYAYAYNDLVSISVHKINFLFGLKVYSQCIYLFGHFFISIYCFYFMFIFTNTFSLTHSGAFYCTWFPF